MWKFQEINLRTIRLTMLLNLTEYNTQHKKPWTQEINIKFKNMKNDIKMRKKNRHKRN